MVVRRHPESGERPDRNATNAIKPERKPRKINEVDRSPAAHNGLVAGSSPAEQPTKSTGNQRRLGGGEGIRSRIAAS
jgi:hypothetical protein